MKNAKVSKSFRKHLNGKLKDKQFADDYKYERELVKIAVMIAKEREKLGLTQNELARIAKITQQQLSKIERGENCNMLTFLKVSRALKLKLLYDSGTAN